MVISQPVQSDVDGEKSKRSLLSKSNVAIYLAIYQLVFQKLWLAIKFIAIINKAI